MNENKNTILVWRSAALGDFILSTPALRLIREYFPDHKILLLTTTAANKVQREKVKKYTGGEQAFPWLKLATPHLIDDVVTIQNFSFNELRSLANYISMFNVDFSIIMADPCAPYLGRLKKVLLLMLLTKSMRIYGWGGGGSLNTSRKKRMLLKQKGLLRHHVFGPARFLLDMKLTKDICAEELKVDLRVSEESISSSKKLLGQWIRRERDNAMIIAFAPGTVQPHKSWPLDKYRELAELILGQYDAEIVVLGTNGDFERAHQIVDGLASVHNLCGETSVEESASIFKQSSIVVGNDGGAVHLADAMGVPVIALTPGLEFADSIEPWNNRSNSIRIDIACAPCYSFTHCPMGHNRCMSDISVDVVFEKVNALLQYISTSKADSNW
jgi:ADP-heptose:LPS heptosyltransferase